MTEEERASLEAMRARENELEGVLAAQEDALREHRRQVWEHQAARERMQAEWDALQGRVQARLAPHACLPACTLDVAASGRACVHAGRLGGAFRAGADPNCGICLSPCQD